MTLECKDEVVHGCGQPQDGELCCGGTGAGVVCNTEDDGGCVSRGGRMGVTRTQRASTPGGDSHREVGGDNRKENWQGQQM
ncbi:hypothetical protein E2C01_063521 [Portunus trituberculatus]|uniref:Uncharacterized protein n=1 Tax=Portunus trituberculatus TaxID=210409 RepID=A0A5B7HAN7_PORTR|nr:hypothetical protein [Portunus trituberculatus]